jgi:polar amino acid transport system permease protein
MSGAQIVTVPPETDAAAPFDRIDAVALRRPGRWVAGLIVLVLLAMLGYSLWHNPNINHGAVSQYFFNGTLIDGLKTTIILTLTAEALGIVVGTLIAVMRMSSNPVLSAVSWLYVWYFRGVPLIVQLLIWGNFALIFRRLIFGIPFTDLSLFSGDTNAIITIFVASVLGLGLTEAAYYSEIVRAGILSVDPGQSEAATAIGFRHHQILGRIVLPQALRVIIPPTGNNLISMMKNTSLVVVIAGGDLLTRAQQLYSTNLLTVEILVIASVYYLALTSIATSAQYYLERFLARGDHRELPPTPWQRCTKAFEPLRIGGHK